MRRRVPLEAEESRPPMWVVDMRFWSEHPDAEQLDRCRLHGAAKDEWMAAHEHWDGLDPFDQVDELGRVYSPGAWRIIEAEAAIRRGERW